MEMSATKLEHMESQMESQTQSKDFVKERLAETECGSEAERIVVAIMSFSPDQTISDGILNLRRFFQNILQDSKDKENRTPPEATRRRVSARKRTRGGTKVNYAALVGKRGGNVEKEKMAGDICLNHVSNVHTCVHKRQNMIKESSLPVPLVRTNRPTTPDPSVYDFPTEWNPDTKTGSLSPNSSVTEIDGASVQMDPPQLRDYHYAELLDTPISHRIGRNQTQKYFSSCLSSEKMRSACIAEVAQRLNNGTTKDKSARKRTRSEEEAIRKQGNVESEGTLKDAEKVVDDMLYLRELLEATDSINKQVQEIKKAFEDRGVGEAPDISDPLALSLELKSRLAKQCHIVTEINIDADSEQ